MERDKEKRKSKTVKREKMKYVKMKTREKKMCASPRL